MRVILALALALVACGDDDPSVPDSAQELARAPCGAPVASPGGTLDPQAWYIGPGNRSVGMPLHPSSHPEGLSFAIPQPPGHVHYVTFNHGPLTGRSRIRMRYRIEADPGVQIHPQSDINSTVKHVSQLSLYFQRAGDNWQADARTETYRWWPSLESRVYPVVPGEYEMIVSLEGDWGAVQRSTSANNPRAFAEAKANAHCVGFVLGGGDGVGHGVYATGSARFVLLGYEVQ